MSSTKESEKVKLESKKYNFVVEDSMPILNLELRSSKSAEDSAPMQQNLTIEIHSPISGEIFEARTSKGRIEVDIDGTITCFSTGDNFAFSAFLGRNLSVSMNKKTGEVILRTPSKIISIEDQRVSNQVGQGEPFTDQIKLILE
jgi:hypothetical protein